MEIPLISKIILYIDISLLGLMCLIVWPWQFMVFRGRPMKNPDGSMDNWHEQKVFYGMALADISVAVPAALGGIALIFFGWGLGFYLTGLASFWFLWANVMTTANSLRFENPRLTLLWFVTFPLGAIVGGV
ncbi:MAG: hypothetical protein FJ134_02435 [Deltaproteobacteria bacterium]|nr:hypothetical protein [Deltaproteobacteria bacterium]